MQRTLVSYHGGNILVPIMDIVCFYMWQSIPWTAEKAKLGGISSLQVSMCCFFLFGSTAAR